MLVSPLTGMLTITGVLLIYFFIDGFVTIYNGIKLRPNNGWGWVMLSGITSLMLGCFIVYNWPDTGLYALGVMVGVRLIMNGWMITMLGMAGVKAAEITRG
ncbi:HdeD family acid-resistance protein [Vibrio variabilis]|uniref:HdeD family acid-resistance protein n=1 Tax=Vibrio variabilis TaxID=990271 RepID=UPI0013A6F2AF|nr:DUF308 domain-containing protein [Vibrio variabilis]